MKQSAEFVEAQREARESGFQSRNFWNLFLDYFSGDPRRLDQGIREQYYDFNRRGPEKNYLAFVGVVANHDRAVAAMNAVKAPTLLIWGGSDQLLVPASADVLAGYLTNTQVSKVFMPDVGHYPPLEAPQRFAQLVSAYIEAATPTH
jgi:pimeloyl-ACP methyl ester carboxylesterase